MLSHTHTRARARAHTHTHTHLATSPHPPVPPLPTPSKTNARTIRTRGIQPAKHNSNRSPKKQARDESAQHALPSPHPLALTTPPGLLPSPAPPRLNTTTAEHGSRGSGPLSSRCAPEPPPPPSSVPKMEPKNFRNDRVDSLVEFQYTVSGRFPHSRAFQHSRRFGGRRTGVFRWRF